MYINIAVIITSLVIIIYQDLKFRKIHVILPIILLVAGFVETKNNGSFHFIINIVFLLVTILVLTIYMSVKHNKFLNPFTNYFGLGDLLFFIAIAPLFSLYNYVVFYILSMFFAIIIYFVFKKVISKETIPLAGYASLLLALIIFSDFLTGTLSLTLINS